MTTRINIRSLDDARPYLGRRVQLSVKSQFGPQKTLGSGVLKLFLRLRADAVGFEDKGALFLVSGFAQDGFCVWIELLDDDEKSAVDCVRGDLEEARSALAAEQANVKRLEAELAVCKELDAREALADKRDADNARWPLPETWCWKWTENARGDAMKAIASNSSRGVIRGCGYCVIRGGVMLSGNAPLEVVKTVLARHQAELDEGLESWDLDPGSFLCYQGYATSGESLHHRRVHTLSLGDRVRLEFEDGRPPSVHIVGTVGYHGSVRVSPGFTLADYDTAKDAHLVSHGLGVTKITKLRPDK